MSNHDYNQQESNCSDDVILAGRSNIGLKWLHILHTMSQTSFQVFSKKINRIYWQRVTEHFQIFA